MVNVTSLGSGRPETSFSGAAAMFLLKEFLGLGIEAIQWNWVGTNKEILQSLSVMGGYAILPVETLAGGRVEESLSGFPLYPQFKILGGYRMPLNFVLMGKCGSLAAASGVVSHEKSFGACRETLQRLGFGDDKLKAVGNNGSAAQMVATDSNFTNHLALGPESAAKAYGLPVLSSGVQDRKAVTTFFLISADSATKPVILQKNRVLFCFRLKHEPQSLWKALGTILDLNLIHIHSVFRSGGYDFIIEAEVPLSLVRGFDSRDDLRHATENLTVLGPFGVVND